MSDAINLHVVAATPDDLFVNCWLAVRLSDGTTDNVRYPSKAEAISHQDNEFHYCYFSFRQSMAGANPKDCQLFLDFNRHAYDQGFRLADPASPELIMPLARGTGPWPQ